MRTDVYRFTFAPTVDITEAESTLHLAILAGEGLFGEARVRMDAAYFVDAPRSVIIVDGSTPVGSALVRIFTAFVVQEFGPDAFSVRRATSAPRSEPVSPMGAAA